MNFSIYATFAQILASAKSGDFKSVACNVGKLITAVTCEPPAALLAMARPPLAGANGADDAIPAAPVTQDELHAAAEQFCHELSTCHHHNEHLVKTGLASDTDTQPGEWSALIAFVLSLLTKYIPKGKDWKPNPFPVSPAVAPIPSVIPTVPQEPVLPNLVKPGEKLPGPPVSDKTSEVTTAPPVEPVTEGEDEESDDHSEPDTTTDDPAAPKPKKPRKPKV